jgi:hypothetical protein
VSGQYEYRVRFYQDEVTRQMEALTLRRAALTEKLLFRDPLQDDEDDALQGCAEHLRKARHEIDRAIEAVTK